MARATSFELRIRPLFRELDREHMLIHRPGLDLWDPVVVKNKATDILSLLEATNPGSYMPPIGYGGPWPGEWIALFKQWVSEGFPSLDLGSSTHYEAIRSADLVQLTATIAKPTAMFAVWPERYFGPAKAAGMPDVVLYQEQRDSPPPVITDEGVGYFRFPATVTSLRVLDAAGLQTVAITSVMTDEFRRRSTERKRPTAQ